MGELPLMLVIEDEYLLLGDMERALADGGFATEGASSGEEAIAKFIDEAKKYKALVADVDLGHGQLNGWDVARRIREKEPAFPVVYVTGATAADWASQGVPNSILIQKPFAPAQLATAISNLLNIGTLPTA
jgi:DNA-binding response OmpR family regulator